MARDLRTLLILAYAAALFAVGLLFLAAPSSGRAIFGLPAEADETLRFINLLGFRDLGLGVGLAALAVSADRRAVGLMLGASAIIPLCDLVFILSQVGFQGFPVALHTGSGGCLAGLSAWSLRKAEVPSAASVTDERGQALPEDGQKRQSGAEAAHRQHPAAQ